MHKIINGSIVFELKATYGIPFDIIFNRILNEEQLNIDWVNFIEAARNNKWWDFQIYNACKLGLSDSLVNKHVQEEILSRMRYYMLIKKHPMMGNK